jgi:hypothetical protein
MAHRHAVADEERVIYGLATAIGALPMTIALATGVPFGVEATLGTFMFGIGLTGLLSTLPQRSRSR